MFRVYRLFTKEQATRMKEDLLSLDWSKGQAKSANLTKKFKNNLEIIPTQENLSGEMSSNLQAAIYNKKQLGMEILPTMISVPKFNRYKDQDKGTYKWHYDASPMGPIDMRTDFSCTIALTDHTEYEGGDLEIELPGNTIIKAPRLKAGECVVYESGLLHQVTPVTKGERISAICWIRSMIKCPIERDILIKLTKVLNDCEDEQRPIKSGSKAYTELTGIQTALAKKWFDV